MELNLKILKCILEGGITSQASLPSQPLYLNFLNTPIHLFNYRQLSDSILSRVTSYSGCISLHLFYIASRSASSKHGKDTSNRCLLLELTDGISLIRGIEQVFLNESSEITIGGKVLILGPVIIRRGIILLRANNFLILSTAKI